MLAFITRAPRTTIHPKTTSQNTTTQTTSNTTVRIYLPSPPPIHLPTHPRTGTATITLSIANHNIPYDTAMAHSDPFRTQCYNGTGYSLYTVEQNSRCLPDTAASRPAYQWGFSAMLTSVVLIVHAV